MSNSTFSGDPGYDMQVNYADGTSNIAMWLDNDTNIAIMHPNGTSDIVSVTQFSGGMGAQLVQSGVSTASIVGRRTLGKLPGWLCGSISAGGGLVGGWAAVVIGELLTDGADTALSPWVYRFGAWGGGTLTGGFLYAVGACG